MGCSCQPLGWGWAIFVWGYALAWFLVTDPVKLLAYRIFDPPKPRLIPKLKRMLSLKPNPNPSLKLEARLRGTRKQKSTLNLRLKPNLNLERSPKSKLNRSLKPKQRHRWI